MQVVYMPKWCYNMVMNGRPVSYQGYFYRGHTIDGVRFIERAKLNSKRVSKPNSCRGGYSYDYAEWERVDLRWTLRASH